MNTGISTDAINFEAFYMFVKKVVESQKAGANSPENKIGEIRSAIDLMEIMMGHDTKEEKA